MYLRVHVHVFFSPYRIDQRSSACTYTQLYKLCIDLLASFPTAADTCRSCYALEHRQDSWFYVCMSVTVKNDVCRPDSQTPFQACQCCNLVHTSLPPSLSLSLSLSLADVKIAVHVATIYMMSVMIGRLCHHDYC